VRAPPDRPAPGAAIPMQAVANLRDLGGWPTRSGGTVRRGAVYRSAGLDAASQADVATLAALGLRTVHDLRTATERSAQPDRLPAGARPVVADVLGGYTQAEMGRLFAVLDDPVRATELLSAGRAEALLAEAYRQIVSRDSAHAAYRTVFGSLLDGATPTLVHCTTGKDRTGWAAAALLLLLGVPDEVVMAEYLLTNEQLLPRLQHVFDAFAEGGGDPDVLLPVLGVRPGYLRTALGVVVERFGTIEGYFADALGLAGAEQRRLRALLVIGPA